MTIHPIRTESQIPSIDFVSLTEVKIGTSEKMDQIPDLTIYPIDDHISDMQWTVFLKLPFQDVAMTELA